MKTIEGMAIWLDEMVSQHSAWWHQDRIREAVDEMVEASGRKITPSYSEYFEFAQSIGARRHR